MRRIFQRMISKKILLLFTIGIFVNASESNLEVLYESKNKSFPSRTYMFFPANFPLNWREAAELCENVPGAVLAKIPNHENESIMRFLLKKSGIKESYWTRNRETISEIVYKKNLDNHEKLSHSEEMKKFESEKEKESESEAGVILKCSYLHPTFGLKKEFCDHHIEGGAICSQKLKFKRPHKGVCPPSMDRPWILLRTESGNVSSISSLKYCQSDNTVLELKCDTESGWESDSCTNKSLALKEKMYVKRHAKFLRPFFNKRKAHSSKMAYKFYSRNQHKFNHPKKNISRKKQHEIVQKDSEASSQYKDISASEFFHNKHGVVTFDQKRFGRSIDPLERKKRSVDPPFLYKLQTKSNEEDNFQNVEDITVVNDKLPKTSDEDINYINSKPNLSNEKILIKGIPDYDDNSQDISFPEQILIGRFYPSNEFDNDDKISKLAEAIVDFINYNEKGLTNSSSFYFEQINDDEMEMKSNSSLSSNTADQNNLEDQTSVDSLFEAPEEHSLHINDNKTENNTLTNKLTIMFLDIDNRTIVKDNLNTSITGSTIQDTLIVKEPNSTETYNEYNQNFNKDTTTDINYHKEANNDLEYTDNKVIQSTDDYENSDNEFHSFSNQHYLTLESYFWSEKGSNNGTKIDDYQMPSTEEASEFNSDQIKNPLEENFTDFKILTNPNGNLNEKTISSTKYLSPTQKTFSIKFNETSHPFATVEPKENDGNTNASDTDITEKNQILTNNSIINILEELDTNNTVYNP